MVVKRNKKGEQIQEPYKPDKVDSRYKIPVSEKTTSHGRVDTVTFPEGFKRVGKKEFNDYSTRNMNLSEKERAYYDKFGKLPLETISKNYKGGITQEQLDAFNAHVASLPDTIVRGGRENLDLASAETQVDDSRQRALQIFQEFQGQGKEIPDELLNSLSPTDLKELDAIKSAFSIGGAGAAGLAILGGAGGSAAGGVGAIPGAAIGAGIGFAGGLIGGYKSELSQQLSNLAQARNTDLQRGEEAITDSISFINGGGDPVLGVQGFRSGIDKIRIAQAQHKLDTQRAAAGMVNEKDIDLQTEFETFFEVNLPILENELQLALVSPDPNKVAQFQSEQEKLKKRIKSQ